MKTNKLLTLIMIAGAQALAMEKEALQRPEQGLPTEMPLARPGENLTRWTAVASCAR